MGSAMGELGGTYELVGLSNNIVCSSEFLSDATQLGRARLVAFDQFHTGWLIGRFGSRCVARGLLIH